MPTSARLTLDSVQSQPEARRLEAKPPADLAVWLTPEALGGGARAPPSGCFKGSRAQNEGSGPKAAFRSITGRDAQHADGDRAPITPERAALNDGGYQCVNLQTPSVPTLTEANFLNPGLGQVAPIAFTHHRATRKRGPVA
jgi:hypothetical protein